MKLYIGSSHYLKNFFPKCPHALFCNQSWEGSIVYKVRLKSTLHHTINAMEERLGFGFLLQISSHSSIVPFIYLSFPLLTHFLSFSLVSVVNSANI